MTAVRLLEIGFLTHFADLNLAARLLDTLARQGYETPTPIQAQSIPPILEGRDLLGCAQTGTGKTAAFSLPLIQRLTEGGHGGGRKTKRRVRALILAPTRELAVQIEESLRTYGRGTGLRGTTIFGGVKQSRQVRDLREGVDVIVATPGRLLDLMEQGHVDLGGVECFVLDEADRMLDMGFIDPIRRIARQLPGERQTLFFSATMPPKIRKLADSMLRDPVSVAVAPVVSAAPLIEQRLYHVPDEHKTALLRHLLEDAAMVRTVVFTKTKHGAEKLAKKLAGEGIAAGAIHGNKSQSQRQRALDAFRAGHSRVLVATDVASRGLDVDGITHVFNFNLPNEPEAYVHRIGRTGRAGATGQAISFCSREERGHLRGIEQLTGARIDTSSIPHGLGIPEQAVIPAGPRTEGPGERRAQKPRRKSGARPAQSGDRHGPKNGAKRRRRRTGASGEGASSRQGSGAGGRRRKS